MTNIQKLIRSLSDQDKKTLSQRCLKVTEEVGELAKAVLPFEAASGTVHRFVDKYAILEEVADIYLTAISVAYSLDFTDEEIEDVILTKAKKWADIQQAEAKVEGKIPYEIHVTVAVAESNDLFTEHCRALDVKPIVLALQKDGAAIRDVMTSSVHLGDNRSAYDEMKRVANGLWALGYEVVREKIETVPWHPAAPTLKSPVMPKDCYFETHIAVNVPDDDNRKAELAHIAEVGEAHLSRNAFKVNSDGSFTQMVTYRLYDDVFENFELYANTLHASIVLEGFDVEKRITEFSIYDTKVSHDSNWLTT